MRQRQDYNPASAAKTALKGRLCSRTRSANETSVDCRTVLRSVLLQNAASFVIAHNHPSGEPRPSVSDIKFTSQLKKACDLMDIKLLDHIVLSNKSFFSFAEEQTLKY